MSLPVDALGFKSVKSIMLENLNFCTFCLKVTLSLVIIKLQLFECSSQNPGFACIPTKVRIVSVGQNCTSKNRSVF